MRDLELESLVARSARWESVMLLASILGALSFVTIGIILSFHLNDPHYLNRAGAAIVCLEAAVAAIEFRRQGRLRIARSLLEERAQRDGVDLDKSLLESSIESAEWGVVRLSLFLGATGEFLHGFGDLLLVPWLLH